MKKVDTEYKGSWADCQEKLKKGDTEQKAEMKRLQDQASSRFPASYSIFVKNLP